jgi:hypothetical protein
VQAKEHLSLLEHNLYNLQAHATLWSDFKRIPPTLNREVRGAFCQCYGLTLSSHPARLGNETLLQGYTACSIVLLIHGGHHQTEYRRSAGYLAFFFAHRRLRFRLSDPRQAFPDFLHYFLQENFWYNALKWTTTTSTLFSINNLKSSSHSTLCRLTNDSALTKLRNEQIIVHAWVIGRYINYRGCVTLNDIRDWLCRSIVNWKGWERRCSVRIGLYSSASGLGPLTGSCEHGNEPSDSIKREEFVDQPRDC